MGREEFGRIKSRHNRPSTTNHIHRIVPSGTNSSRSSFPPHPQHAPSALSVLWRGVCRFYESKYHVSTNTHLNTRPNRSEGPRTPLHPVQHHLSLTALNITLLLCRLSLEGLSRHRTSGRVVDLLYVSHRKAAAQVGLCWCYWTSKLSQPRPNSLRANRPQCLCMRRGKRHLQPEGLGQSVRGRVRPSSLSQRHPKL